MIAEILSVGTELLMGQIANTDAQYISRRLSELGVTLYRHTTVGDNPARVKQALCEALSRSDMVITTGGLGPTEDDLTKEMVGEFFGLPMELDEKSLEAVRARMCRLGREMTENNNKQAYFPRGAVIMPNAVRHRAGLHRRARRQGRGRAARPAARDEGHVRAPARALAAQALGRAHRIALSAHFRRGRVQDRNGAARPLPRRQPHPRPLLRRGRGDGAHQRPRAPGRGRERSHRPHGGGDPPAAGKRRLRRLRPRRGSQPGLDGAKDAHARAARP